MAATEQAKHTAGPWEWDSGVIPPDGPGRYADIYKDGGDLIIASFNDLIPEGRANARLIAAAPELLEALRSALSAANELELSSAHFPREQILAALSKAEGL